MIEQSLIIKPQDSTQRVKGINFSQITPIEQIDGVMNRLWTEASQFSQPLTQARIIIPIKNEAELVERVSKTNGLTRGVGAKIPFRHNDEGFAIYYLQQSSDRPQYRFNDQTKDLSHIEAVTKGYRKRATFDQNRPVDDRFLIQIDDYSDNEGVNIITGQTSSLPKDEFISQIINVHKSAFAYPHDESQRQQDGIRHILDHNPIITSFDKKKRKIAAVSFWETDPQFNFGDITLVEPTYFTDPSYEKNGLSITLRKATQDLVTRSSEITIYKGNPVIIFNESIRAISFPLCLQVGCDLGGDLNSPIQGNLGEAYTHIGPANPQTGLMPMGLTYFVDPRIRYN